MDANTKYVVVDIDNIYNAAKTAFNKIWNQLVSSDDTKKYVEAKKKWEDSECYKEYERLKEACGGCADMDLVAKKYPDDYEEYKKARKAFSNSVALEEFGIKKRLIREFIVKESFYIPDFWCVNMHEIFGFDVN